MNRRSTSALNGKDMRNSHDKPVLVSLIGEQILPNLLPLKYLKPRISLAVYSDFTKKGYERLERAIRGEIKVIPCEVEAYNIDAILPVLRGALGQFDAADISFNLTGGTKPMSIAAYLAAVESGAPMIYFQTEGKRSRVLKYETHGGKVIMVGDEFLPPVITLDEYLRAHVEILPARKRKVADEGHVFERAVFDALSHMVDEIKMGINIQGAVQVDLGIRCENQVGIMEVKTGSSKLKMAIDQLNTAGEQRFLGTYTQKFLASDQDWSKFSDLRELAKAHRITLIELPEFSQKKNLVTAAIDRLRTSVLKGLGR